METLALIGDSLAARYPTVLFPGNMKAKMKTHATRVTDYVNSNMVKFVTSYPKPDVAILLMGGNDIDHIKKDAEDHPPTDEQIADALIQTARAIHKENIIVIVVPIAPRTPRYTTLQSYNKRMVKINIILKDQLPLYLGYNPLTPIRMEREMLFDMVHFTNNEYDQLTTDIMEQIYLAKRNRPVTHQRAIQPQYPRPRPRYPQPDIQNQAIRPFHPQVQVNRINPNLERLRQCLRDSIITVNTENKEKVGTQEKLFDLVKLHQRLQSNAVVSDPTWLRSIIAQIEHLIATGMGAETVSVYYSFMHKPTNNVLQEVELSSTTQQTQTISTDLRNIGTQTDIDVHNSSTQTDVDDHSTGTRTDTTEAQAHSFNPQTHQRNIMTDIDVHSTGIRTDTTEAQTHSLNPPTHQRNIIDELSQMITWTVISQMENLATDTPLD
ncbi:unnamed protein product, partial [Meganyctiphanes norvegica]